MNKIICGDALEELKKLPSGSVNMCMTSPPYWSHRNYQVEGQIGLESNFEMKLKTLKEKIEHEKELARQLGSEVYCAVLRMEVCIKEFIKQGDKIFCSDYGKDNVTNEEYDYANKKWEELKEELK